MPSADPAAGRTGPPPGPSSWPAPPGRARRRRGKTVLKSSTAINWIIGRCGTTGSSDYLAVHVLQDGTRLTPLSRWTGDPEEYTSLRA
uniref:DUF1254 domain-containing protein n=1 Tax=Streptomyces sp. MH60 TaxID=1940758 RepID=UPI001F545F90|nr:DUF1254 domain-containing protein [Streptomyces sp. MH60]